MSINPIVRNSLHLDCCASAGQARDVDRAATYDARIVHTCAVHDLCVLALRLQEMHMRAHATNSHTQSCTAHACMARVGLGFTRNAHARICHEGTYTQSNTRTHACPFCHRAIAAIGLPMRSGHCPGVVGFDGGRFSCVALLRLPLSSMTAV